jgi:Transposase DDE domain group 1
LIRVEFGLSSPNLQQKWERATPAITDDNLLPFSFPAVARKKVTAAFDGGRITSDGGVMLLAQAERRLGIADQLARMIPDERDADRVIHLLPDILRARIFAIACGYGDADDLDRLRSDPALKLACGRLPNTGRDLCSQPTVSRWENAPSLRDLIRMMGVLIDLYCASYAVPPAAVTLDIDDTVDVVHGHQQLSLFNAHYDERCFLPIHVYDTATSRPVAVLLRPGKTPSGIEVRGHLRRLVRRIRRHWPQARITIRGDSHYGRPEVMEWCDENAVDFVFGLPGNAVLDRLVDETADDIRTRRALDQKPYVRGFAETSYRAKSWNTDRRACARIEAATKGLDIRFVVTSIETGSAEHIYDTLYCARGQAENLIKLHKAQLASDRTSCRSPLANQMRLILHTAAYWLLLTVRDAIPKANPLATAEFATIRLRLLKLGARVIEMASRVRPAFAAACPDATLIRHIAAALMPAGP